MLENKVRRWFCSVGIVFVAVAGVAAEKRSREAMRVGLLNDLGVAVVDMEKAASAVAWLSTEMEKVETARKDKHAAINEMVMKARQNDVAISTMGYTTERLLAVMENDLLRDRADKEYKIFEHEYSEQHNRLLTRAVEEAGTAVNNVSKRLGLKLVVGIDNGFSSNQVDRFKQKAVWFAAPELDITQQVIAELQPTGHAQDGK